MIDRQKLIEVFGKGGPARDIMLGNGAGGPWADAICDALITHLEIVATREDLTHADEPHLGSSDLDILLLDQIDNNNLVDVKLVLTGEGRWQASTSRNGLRSWSCETHAEPLTALTRSLNK